VNADQPSYRTGIGTSTPDTITLLGHDLARDLLGQVTFGELAFWLIAKRRPTPAQGAMFEAVLVALADHGFTPTALAARLTYTSAPESLQGAVAAGLLGGGSRFLGVTEDAARFLAESLAGVQVPPDDEAGWDELAAEVVAAAKAAGRLVPGLGHPVHKVQDPRTPRIYTIAEETGRLGPHLQLLRHVAAAHRAESGRELPVNGAGVAGAALADLGFRAELLRGFALLARTAGLLGHLAEEMERPLGMPLYREVDERATYEPPPG
jgi:citrate synthase